MAGGRETNGWCAGNFVMCLPALAFLCGCSTTVERRRPLDAEAFELEEAIEVVEFCELGRLVAALERQCKVYRADFERSDMPAMLNSGNTLCGQIDDLEVRLRAIIRRDPTFQSERLARELEAGLIPRFAKAAADSDRILQYIR